MCLTVILTLGLSSSLPSTISWERQVELVVLFWSLEQVSSKTGLETSFLGRLKVMGSNSMYTDDRQGPGIKRSQFSFNGYILLSKFSISYQVSWNSLCLMERLVYLTCTASPCASARSSDRCGLGSGTSRYLPNTGHSGLLSLLSLVSVSVSVKFVIVFIIWKD